jgi:quinol monooxygenase YgiN
MYARTTLFEVDTQRTSIDAALERFSETVLPRLREQPGCLGVIVMQTPEGKGMLVSFWQSSEAAAATLESGFYDEQVRELLMFLRQPPGREQYEVSCYELSDAIVTGRPVFSKQSA